MQRVITRERDGNGKIVYQHEATTRFVQPKRYEGPWSGMVQFSLEGIQELRARLDDHSIGMQSMRVLFAMLSSVDLHDDNKVRAGRKDLARMLGMTESNVSGAIKKLVDCGFVEPPKLKFSYYTISPRFAWYGTGTDLRAALAERGMLDDKGMMRPKAA